MGKFQMFFGSIMLPIKILRLFESQNESALVLPKRSKLPTLAAAQVPQPLSWPEIDRRSGADRRQLDRRQQQQAIILDTRKVQGRRRCAGRRQDDLPAIRYSLTVKG